ncbi:MAG: hypothetical protein GY832_23240 [Chloroflexi bacterium]|nr:hypothetical protein [Chloroflexota bacterium]
MSNKIVDRIVREIGIQDLVEILAERLSPSDLQSLLIAVYKRRAELLAPRDLVNQYQQNRFVQPSQASPIALLEFDRLAYSLLPPDFDPVELSPVAPLGVCSAMSTVSQNNIVSTIRNTEVCSDLTNVLALECARRRRLALRDDARALNRVKLCASHRHLRAQRFKGPASFAHFNIFGLDTAGRDEGSFKFEVDALIEQMDFYVRLLIAADKLGYKVEDIRVSVTALDERWLKALQANVLDELSSKYPSVAFAFNQDRQSGRGYYVNACFGIHAQNQSGTEYFLVDGGFTTWTQQLLSNRKERLLISGIGSERMCVCFGNQTVDT